MRKNKKRYVIIMIIFVCMILFITNFIKYDFLQEDLLFFQIFNLKTHSPNITDRNKEELKEINEKSSANVKNVYFRIQYQNKKLKALNLSDTVNNKTLLYEKIAPGTSGRFDIILTSNENLNYKIEFESENEKPSNLQFYTSEEGKRYNTLEELGESLTGTILKKEEKVIPVCWKWEYEISREQNRQDTLEAKKIREYHFLIYVQGY